MTTRETKTTDGDQSARAERGEGEQDTLRIHPHLTVLFSAFDAESISWCVLRGEADLLAPTGDVDLLVAPSDLLRLWAVAEQYRFARVPARGYGSHAFFLTYHEPSNLWIKLDVVTELAFGSGFSLATGAERQCLAQRQYVRGIPALRAVDAFWSLTLHRLLDERGAVRGSDAARLQELVSAVGEDSPLGRLVDSICPAGWSAKRIVELVERGDWAAFAQFAPRLATAWSRYRRSDVRRRHIANGFKRWSGKLLPLGPRRGLGVALLGPDGAGKSTLTDVVERSFYFPTRRLYMGLYQNPSQRSARRGIPGGGLMGRVATQGARWLKGAYHQRRGRLVLFDRYSYDALLPARRRQDWRVRTHRWLLAHSCPPPDLVIVLDAPSEVLYARKGELTVALLEREREAYRALLPRLPRGIVVDTTGDPESVSRAVTAIIWREYVWRWNRRRRRANRPVNDHSARGAETCAS